MDDALPTQLATFLCNITVLHFY